MIVIDPPPELLSVALHGSSLSSPIGLLTACSSDPDIPSVVVIVIGDFLCCSLLLLLPPGDCGGPLGGEEEEKEEKEESIDDTLERLTFFE